MFGSLGLVMIREGWRRGGGVRGGTSARRGAHRLTLAPCLRRQFHRPDRKADEVGDELHRNAERGRRELHDVVTAVVAMGRRPKPVHALQSEKLGPIHYFGVALMIMTLRLKKGDVRRKKKISFLDLYHPPRQNSSGRPKKQVSISINYSEPSMLSLQVTPQTQLINHSQRKFFRPW